MVAQDTPVLEASNRVIDPGSTSTMATPPSVTQDLSSAKDRGDELGNSAVRTVGKGAAMLLAERLDGRVTVVHDIVAVARATRSDGEDRVGG